MLMPRECRSMKCGYPRASKYATATLLQVSQRDADIPFDASEIYAPFSHIAAIAADFCCTFHDATNARFMMPAFDYIDAKFSPLGALLLPPQMPLLIDISIC